MNAAGKTIPGVAPIPEGYRTVTPYLAVRGAERAIAFYKKAFGAQETERIPGQDGRGILRATIRIGDSRVLLGEEFPVHIHLYVEDVDAAVEKAVKAGATLKMPAEDMFSGDRYARIADPFGYEWGMATRKEDLTPEELRVRSEDYFRGQGGG